MVLIELTDDGAAVMEENAEHYLNRRLVVLSDGRMLTAPYVRSPLSRRVGITSRDGGLIGGEVKAYIKRLNDFAATRTTGG